MDEDTQKALNRVDEQFTQSCDRLVDRLAQMETTLLTEFTRMAMYFESRLYLSESMLVGLNERLILLEERGSKLEHKRIAS